MSKTKLLSGGLLKRQQKARDDRTSKLMDKIRAHADAESDARARKIMDRLADSAAAGETIKFRRPQSFAAPEPAPTPERVLVCERVCLGEDGAIVLLHEGGMNWIIARDVVLRIVKLLDSIIKEPA
ncbi:MAG: hypothetical protein H0W40_19340 [Methylibium sp.]|uniref:hypothetical protein n=1 Tax=Methylibium sp. TaxID=2067992 RepID=UPI001828FE80|nr:hypothetical protein [Methylibium sp.]MBA3599500.1 hypothetical protein [Methylibium sp.]